jgi:hypothetical protein
MIKLLSIAKRDGIYVSRKVMNADAWVKWAQQFGVPNPVTADDMHVTVIASRVDVKIAPNTDVVQVYKDRMSFGFLGPNADVFTVMFCDWLLTDRNYAFISAGATSDWPCYRPHVTLSYSAANFEISDEALAAMPPSLIFGPEQYGPFSPTAVADVTKAYDGSDEPYVPPAIVSGQAKGLLTQPGEAGRAMLAKMDVLQLQTLACLKSGLQVTKADFDALPEAVRAELGKNSPPGATPEAKSIIAKGDDEDRMVYGFASVSLTKNGMVVDSHGHEIDTRALRRLCHGLFRSQRAGKLLHQGEKATDIVEGVVFTPSLWKAIGEYLQNIGEIDAAGAEVFKSLEFEGLLTGFFVEDDALWEFAKTHDFELSIGAEEGLLVELDNASQP